MPRTSQEANRSTLLSRLPYFLRRQKAGFSRRFERLDCVVLGAMKAIDIGAEFEGVVLELSQGGCTFRPTTMYLLDRTGEQVSVSTEYFQVEGLIKMARADGYGIQFFRELDADTVALVIAEHGGKIADTSLGRRGYDKLSVF